MTETAQNAPASLLRALPTPLFFKFRPPKPLIGIFALLSAASGSLAGIWSAGWTNSDPAIGAMFGLVAAGVTTIVGCVIGALVKDSQRIRASHQIQQRLFVVTSIVTNLSDDQGHQQDPIVRFQMGPGHYEQLSMPMRHIQWAETTEDVDEVRFPEAFYDAQNSLQWGGVMVVLQKNCPFSP